MKIKRLPEITYLPLCLDFFPCIKTTRKRVKERQREREYVERKDKNTRYILMRGNGNTVDGVYVKQEIAPSHRTLF